ncbi:MAG: hypothetical protein IGS03_01280 [Candidatus Sericytochromatia bacterium]|nr:hypothetical protein [Candidatus Sericytochromatia bacterium]
MFKNRQFWSGLALGCVLTAGVAVIQPLQAQQEAKDPSVALIAKALVEMGKQQRQMAQDLAQVKSHTESMSKGIANLNKTQGF